MEWMRCSEAPPEMAKTCGDRDDETHMRLGQLVQRRLVVLLAPEHGEIMFLAALEIGRLHGRLHELAAGGDRRHSHAFAP